MTADKNLLCKYPQNTPLFDAAPHRVISLIGRVGMGWKGFRERLEEDAFPFHEQYINMVKNNINYLAGSMAHWLSEPFQVRTI